MTFSGLELSAIMKLATAMAFADGKIAPEEIAVQSVELAKFGVAQDDVQNILNNAQNLDSGLAISIVSRMNLLHKKYVTGFLAAMMASDGDIDDSEVAMWQLISSLTELPTMRASEAISYWQNAD